MPRTPTTPANATVLEFLNAEATKAAEAKAAYVAQGYIECAVPGCDGLVSPRFIVEFKGAKMGKCPRAQQHRRLGF